MCFNTRGFQWILTCYMFVNILPLESDLALFCFIFIRIFVYFPLEFLHFFSPAFNNIFCHLLYVSLVPYLRDILALSTYFTLNLFDCWCKLLKISCEQGFHFKSKAFFCLTHNLSFEIKDDLWFCRFVWFWDCCNASDFVLPWNFISEFKFDTTLRSILLLTI